MIMRRTILFPVALIFVTGIFFWKFFVQGLLPIPSDTIIGLYHPYRDLYATEYPNGIPYKNPLITDPVRQQYPWRFIAIQQIKQGEWPVWNPYSFAGTPLLANLQSAPFYPLNIFFFIFPFHSAWSLLVILQPVLAGLFLYLYLREMKLSRRAAVFGGFVFSFCGFNMAWLTWNTLGHVALWLPLVLYLKERVLKLLAEQKRNWRRIFLWGAVIVFSECAYIFAGHIQTALYAVAFSTIYVLFRLFSLYRYERVAGGIVFVYQSFALFALKVFLVAAIVSVQMVPFFNFVLKSARLSDPDVINQEGWFIPLSHLIQFVAPDFFGNPATNNYWGTWNYGEMVGYIGIIPLVFSLIALVWRRDRKTMFFTASLGIALLFATENIVAKIPYMLQIPFLSTSQPTRLLFLADFSLAVLAGLGLDFLLNKKISIKKLCVPLGIVGATLAMLWLYVISGINPDLATAKRNLILPSALFAVGIFPLILLVRTLRLPRHSVYLVIVCITVFDLFRFGWKFTPFTPDAYLFPDTEVIEFLTAQRGKFRIMATHNEILPPNFSNVYGLESVSGYDPLYLRNYAELASAWSRTAPENNLIDFNRIITPDKFNSRITNLLNVRYVLSLDTITAEDLMLVFEEGRTKVYENMDVLPRAYLVNSIIPASSEEEVLERIFDESVNLQNTAVIQSEFPALDSAPLSSTEMVEILDYSASKVTISSTTESTRMLVLSDTYDENWRAYIDGEESDVYRVNYMLRGVVVPEGTHIIEFSYSLYK